MTHQPEISDNPFIFKGVDLRIVARRQRMVLWFLLTVFLPVYLLTLTATPIFGIIDSRILSVGADILRIAGYVLVFGVFMLMRASKTRLPALVCGSLVLLFPYIRMLVLYSENVHVSELLREAGLEVSLMGVKDEVIVIRFGKGLCRNCGYNLTGNTSGTCPECGTQIHPAGVETDKPLSSVIKQND